MSCRAVGSEPKPGSTGETAPRNHKGDKPNAVTPSDDTLIACDRSPCIIEEGVNVTAAIAGVVHHPVSPVPSPQRWLTFASSRSRAFLRK